MISSEPSDISELSVTRFYRCGLPARIDAG
jgi:hypothetical protein